MTDTITLYGAHISPFVRKVRLALAYKQCPYQHIPVVPFGSGQPAAFKQHSPLGKIPLLQVGEHWIPDSSAMLAWLERAHPAPAMLPEGPLAVARAVWFEEYADSHMSGIIAGQLFLERVLAPAVFQRPSNEEVIKDAIEQGIPSICTYLEGELQEDYLVNNQLTLADLAVGGLFVTLLHCGIECDADKWPKLASYIERLHSTPLFANIINEEKQILQIMSKQQAAS